MGNSLHHEWTLLGGAAALFGLVVYPVYWILKKPETEITEKGLEIKSLLTDVFESLVIQEARTLIAGVDDHLITALTEARKGPGTSRFEQLAAGLQEIDPENPEPGRYQSLLQDAIGGALRSKANELLDRVEQASNDETVRDPTGLHVNLSHKTRSKLFKIADIASEVDNKKTVFQITRQHLRISFISAIGFLVIGTIGMFFKHYIIYYIASTGFIGSLFLLLYSIYKTYKAWHCLTWLSEKSSQYVSGEELIENS